MSFKQSVAGVAGIAVLALGASTAHAATVTVQIEGVPLVQGPTVVSTPATVTKDGGATSCPGNTAAGALEAATGGAWSGTFNAQFGTYSVDAIRGEARPFGSGSFWSIYKNGEAPSFGACGITVADGDDLLFYAADDNFIDGRGGYAEEPLQLTGPTAVTPGQPFTVTVTESVTDQTTFVTAKRPSAGTTVTAGPASATTGPDGRATLTVPAAGPLAVVAVKGDRPPDRYAACASTGADGACGTSATGALGTPGAPATTCLTTGRDGFCGSPDLVAGFGAIRSVEEKQVFARGRGPRELGGIVDRETQVRDVSLRLSGRDGRRCVRFDGERERLVTTRRCGATGAGFFSIGQRADWTYLLPERLGRGRWVLDVRVEDRAGNVNTTLQRGRSRVVFTVR